MIFKRKDTQRLIQTRSNKGKQTAEHIKEWVILGSFYYAQKTLRMHMSLKMIFT